MYDYYFTFRSVTVAKRGGRTLEGAGVAPLMVRTPSNLRQMGCGYSLRVRERELPAALEALNAADVPFQRLYRKTEEGKWQEVTL